MSFLVHFNNLAVIRKFPLHNLNATRICSAGDIELLLKILLSIRFFTHLSRFAEANITIGWNENHCKSTFGLETGISNIRIPSM